VKKYRAKWFSRPRAPTRRCRAGVPVCIASNLTWASAVEERTSMPPSGPAVVTWASAWPKWRIHAAAFASAACHESMRVGAGWSVIAGAFGSRERDTCWSG
jgi:hypothetical protein